MANPEAFLCPVARPPEGVDFMTIIQLASGTLSEALKARPIMPYFIFSKSRGKLACQAPNHVKSLIANRIDLAL